MKFNQTDNIPVTFQWRHDQIIGRAKLNEDGSVSFTITDPAIIDLIKGPDFLTAFSVDMVEKTVAPIMDESHIVRGEE